jgi:hypothetical protein
MEIVRVETEVGSISVVKLMVMLEVMGAECEFGAG